MFKKNLTSLVEGVEITDATEDIKQGKTVGKYKVTPNGIYRPDNKYLPKSAITEVIQDKGSVHVTGCCAGGVPVDRLVIKTVADPFIFIFDSTKQVSKVREILSI